MSALFARCATASSFCWCCRGDGRRVAGLRFLGCSISGLDLLTMIGFIILLALVVNA